MSTRDRLRILDERVLSDGWALVKATRLQWRRRDGNWQEQTIETFDRGDGAAVLPCDPERRTVLLIRQFRFPAFANDGDGLLIEVAAGKLDGASAPERIRTEAEEEMGYRLHDVSQVYDIFSSPGSLTERLILFTARYSAADRVSDGGGLSDEHEDIEVLEMDIDDALRAVAEGRIRDAKTILLLQHTALHPTPT